MVIGYVKGTTIKWQNCVEQIVMERRKLVYKFKEFLKATRKQKT